MFRTRTLLQGKMLTDPKILPQFFVSDLTNMMHSFNPEQQTIIDLNQGWHSCLASAGSGKTEILTERVYRAIQAGIDPKRMLCLTFTNRAAMSMQHKVQQRLQQAELQVFTGNIHAFCTAYLQHNRVHHGVQQLANEQVADALWVKALGKVTDLIERGAGDVQEVLEENARQVGFERYQLSLNPSQLELAKRGLLAQKSYDRWDLKKIQRLMLPLLPDSVALVDEAFKAELRQQLKVIDPRITAAKLVNFALGLALYAHAEYARLKQRLSLYDFDDLIIQTLQHLAQYPTAQMRDYLWCQIDEVQDIAPLQWLIIGRLLAPDAHVLLFGDVNQSIYRFMGASLETTRVHVGNQALSLLRNYRSPQNLVEMTNQYCQLHFSSESSQDVLAHHPARPDALLHLHRHYDSDHDTAMIQYAQSLVARQQSVAILLPTNQKVTAYSQALSQRGIEHFCINQHDIFRSEAALDFMAFITAIIEPKNRVAWSRLFWRFGDIAHHQPKQLRETEPQLSALLMTAKLGALGGDLVDFLQHPDCYQHRLRRLVTALQQDNWLFFDTETTGLDPQQADIIQLAAISPNLSSTTELNLYCQTAQSLADTAQIHRITAELLAAQGQPIADQLTRFLQFTKQRVLIAHNLAFDHAMLSQQLRTHAPEQYAAYLAHERFCSLQLTQQLFPALESYALGALLKQFNLEGVNSHDARDDVRAGMHLMQYLAPYAAQRAAQLDALVDDIQPAIERFMQQFAPLWQRVQQLIEQHACLSMDQLLDLYFNAVQESGSYSFDAIEQLKLAEFKHKISRHAQQSFAVTALPDYLKQIVRFYKTAKESDLITDDDQFIVSTIHRSKGLEFEYVLLPAVMENNFPSFMVMNQLEHSDTAVRAEAELLLQEQKRLLYVALTRAKQQLVIGSYEMQAGRYHKAASPFIRPLLSYFTAV